MFCSLTASGSSSIESWYVLTDLSLCLLFIVVYRKLSGRDEIIEQQDVCDADTGVVSPITRSSLARHVAEAVEAYLYFEVSNCVLYAYRTRL